MTGRHGNRQLVSIPTQHTVSETLFIGPVNLHENVDGRFNIILKEINEGK